MEIKILCPSKGRADRLISTKLIPELIAVVSHKEVDDYKAYNDCEVVGTPKEVKGITATRQWILDEYKDYTVFMIDDDLKDIRKNWVGEGEEQKITEPEHAKDIIYHVADVARQLKSNLFGFSSIRTPVQYNTQEPNKLKGYLNNSYMGFLKGHNLSYNLDYIEGEDHYINLLNKYKNRFHYVENRWSFHTDKNFQNLGGCSGSRTIETMKKTTLMLRKKFGTAVRFKMPTQLKKNVYEGERSIVTPY